MEVAIKARVTKRKEEEKTRESAARGRGRQRSPEEWGRKVKSPMVQQGSSPPASRSAVGVSHLDFYRREEGDQMPRARARNYFTNQWSPRDDGVRDGSRPHAVLDGARPGQPWARHNGMQGSRDDRERDNSESVVAQRHRGHSRGASRDGCGGRFVDR